jgi:O-antigen/teichoic acid export membrane protein
MSSCNPAVIEAPARPIQSGWKQALSYFRGSKAHQRILSGGLIMLVSSTVVALLNFAYNVQVAQRLGPADFGHVATLVTLLLMASSLTLSFQIVCAKFVARNQEPGAKAAVFRSLRRNAWIVGLALAGLLCAISFPIANYLNFPSVWMPLLLAIGIAFYIPLGVKRGTFQGTCAFPRLAGNFMLEAASKFLLALLLVTWFGAMGAVVAMTMSVIVAYWLPTVTDTFRRPSQLHVAASAREGLQAVLFFVGQVLILNADMIVVKHLFPPEQAGIYAAVALVGRVLFYASWSVIGAMFPVSAEAGRQRPQRSLLVVPTILVTGMFLSFVALVALFPASIMKTIFGPGFQQSEPLLVLYAAATAAYALSAMLMAYEISHKVANTGWLQIVAGILVFTGIYLFHSSLRQVVLVLMTIMVGLLVAVSVPFLRSVLRRDVLPAGEAAA